VLTRDTALLKRKKNIFVRRVRADLPYDQVSEVVHLFGLEQKATFFSRCPECSRMFWRGSHVENMKEKFSALGISING